MKKIAIYPGSFDPFTNGHLDILLRSLEIFDGVIIAVTKVAHKKPLFSVEERVSMLKKLTEKWKNVKAESFDGLLVDYAKDKGATAVIRGLRAISDFEYEFQMALMNRHLSEKFSPTGKIETVFLMPDEKYTYLSSTLVKEVAALGGNIKSFVPPLVENALLKKLKRI